MVEVALGFRYACKGVCTVCSSVFPFFMVGGDADSVPLVPGFEERVREF